MSCLKGAIASLIGLVFLGCSRPTAPTGDAASSASSSPSSAPLAAAPTTSSSSASLGSDSVGKRAPMNVILLVVDALRWDMPWEGYHRQNAPNLSALYEKSVRYERGYAAASFTSKSVPTLLSGRYPSELHRTTPFFTRYLDKNIMLAEVLQKQGVRTISGQAHKYLDEASGLTQGFDTWKLVPGITFDYQKDPYITGPKHTELAIQLLGGLKSPSDRFFAYFHYMDPHDTYHPHAESPNFGRKGRDLYDQEVFFTDLWIQKLFDYVDAQPWGKNTAIIITGDHGEAFGEHNLYRHAFEIYDVLVRVPLFMRIPGATARRIPRWRGHIDLAPTILDLIGVGIPEELPGKSLVAELYGRDEEQRPILVDLPADKYNVKHRALIEGGWKLISLGKDIRFELFHVAEDPQEKTNLYGKDKEKSATMLARFRELWAKVQVVEATGGGSVKPD